MVDAPRLVTSILTSSAFVRLQEEPGEIRRLTVPSSANAAENWEAPMLTGTARVVPLISVGTIAVRSSPAPAREEARAARSASDWYCGSTESELASCPVCACQAARSPAPDVPQLPSVEPGVK